MSPIPVAAVVAGVLIIATVLYDAFEVMLLPRRVRHRFWLVRVFFDSTWAVWAAWGRRMPSVRRRELFLSHYGPLSMAVLLVLWSASLIVGFGLLQWALHAHTADAPGLGTQLYSSGGTFFTLGYGDVTPYTRTAKALAVVESGTGLGLLAVTIGYLPVLYQLFGRREAHVIMLDARAGSPPRAATLLVRHAHEQSFDELGTLLRDWERWTAELLESHISYPMLGYYRSQHDNQSWLAALTAILDSCALVLIGLDGVRSFRARMTFTTGCLAAVEMIRVFHLAVAAEPADRLPPEAFARLRAELADAGLTMSGDAPEAALAAIRATYEPMVQVLADYLLLSLPTWEAPAR